MKKDISVHKFLKRIAYPDPEDRHRVLYPCQATIIRNSKAHPQVRDPEKQLAKAKRKLEKKTRRKKK